MKVLHIFRSSPDETTLQLAEGFSVSNDSQSIELYNTIIDYAQMINDIFESDQIICWW